MNDLKTIGLIVVVTTFASGVASAQAPPVPIDDLRAPTSPAFVLLDVAPASVERPENPKAFTTSLIHTVTQNNGLPQNYALEVAPYWLTYHPELTFEKYQSPGLMSAIHSLSMSVATTPMKATEGSTVDPSGSRVGIGVRSNLMNGRFNPKLGALVAELAGIHDKILDALSKGLPIDKLEAEAQTTALAIQALDAQRIGFILSVAAGKIWDFPGDDFTTVKDGRWGVWVTPTYRFLTCGEPDNCRATFDAIAVLRALREPDEDASWDFGGRIVWQPNTELSLSLETVRRRGGDSETQEGVNSNRTAGMLEYRINADLSLYGTFGQDFKKIAGSKPLISLIGLNVGFGKTPQVKAK